VRAAIVEQVCRECGKEDRGYAAARGNIVDVLVDAGFAIQVVLRAASAHSGVPMAPAGMMPPPWPDAFDLDDCRALGAFPLAFVRGTWRVAYADPEQASRAVRHGLPPHRPVLVDSERLERWFAGIEVDPFAARPTEVGEAPQVKRPARGVDITEEQPEDEQPPESIVAWDDDDDDDGEVMSVPEGQPASPRAAKPKFVDDDGEDEPTNREPPRPANRLPPAAKAAAAADDDDDDPTNRAPPRPANRLPPAAKAAAAPDDDDDDDDMDLFVDRQVTSPGRAEARPSPRPALAAQPSATNTSSLPGAMRPSMSTSSNPAARPPSSSSTGETAKPPPPPPRPPTRLKQTKPPPPPPRMTAAQIAPPAPSAVRQRVLSVAAVVCVVGGGILAANWLSQPKDDAVGPELRNGQLDVTPMQIAVIAQAKSAPTPEKAVALFSHAYDFDRETVPAHEALLARAKLLVTLRRAGSAARDLELLKRHPRETPPEELKALSDAIAALTLVVPAPPPPDFAPPPEQADPTGQTEPAPPSPTEPTTSPP